MSAGARQVLVVVDGGLLAPSAEHNSPNAPRLQADVLASLQRLRKAGVEIWLVVAKTRVAAPETEFARALCNSQSIPVSRELVLSTTAPADIAAAVSADAAPVTVIVTGANAESPPATTAPRVYHLDASAPATSWPAIANEILARTAQIERTTKETSIRAAVNLDATAPIQVATGIGFFDHMLEQLAKHGGFALELGCRGDLHIDEHHTVEDCALALGEALRRALGAKLGIARYGFLLAMDEAEAQVAIDLSGRAYFVFRGQFARDAVGGLPTELVPHFFRSLADSLGAAIHVSVQGENTHHMVESCFKGVGRALRQALRRDGDDLPSTKGAL